jgi:hypothetical protein
MVEDYFFQNEIIVLLKETEYNGVKFLKGTRAKFFNVGFNKMDSEYVFNFQTLESSDFFQVSVHSSSTKDVFEFVEKEE